MDMKDALKLGRKTASFFFLCAVILVWVFFFFSPHTSPNVFVSHWKPTNACVRGFAMSSWKKDPWCAGKQNLFCQEHHLFCVCVVISQTLHFSLHLSHRGNKETSCTWNPVALSHCSGGAESGINHQIITCFILFLCRILLYWWVYYGSVR